MPDTFDTAVALLNSADEEKRLEGIRLCGTIKKARTAEALIEFVRREVMQMQYGWLFMMRGLRFLFLHYSPMIEDMRRQNLRLAEAAAQSLVSIGHLAVAPLMAALKKSSAYTVADELFVWAMGEIGNIEALPVLHRIQTPHTEISLILAAHEAVRKIKSANADILDQPIPAAEPPPPVENLPRPAQPLELTTEDRLRPSDGLFTDGTD